MGQFVLRECISVAVILSTCLSICGCYYFSTGQYEEITTKPVSTWDYRDCLVIMASAISHNLFDYRTNIKVVATPYYPSVVLAIQSNAKRNNHWSEFEFRINVDGLLKENVGMYFDWETGKFMDAKGNYFRNALQIDSLMFLISIENKAWNTMNSVAQVNYCGVAPITVPLISFDNSYIPDITNLEERIYLVNDKNKFIKPRHVWGRQRSCLTIEETLFAMFDLRNNDHHFLSGSENMYLVIKGFESDIKLTFPLLLMR